MVNFGGRKFIGFLMILSAAGLVRYLTKAPLAHEDVLFLIAAYGTFAFGNIANTLAALRSGSSGGGQSGAPAAATPVDLSGFEARLSIITEGVQAQNAALLTVAQQLAQRGNPRAVESFDTAGQADPEVVERAKANRAAISQYVRPN